MLMKVNFTKSQKVTKLLYLINYRCDRHKETNLKLINCIILAIFRCDQSVEEMQDLIDNFRRNTFRLIKDDNIHNFYSFHC